MMQDESGGVVIQPSIQRKRVVDDPSLLRALGEIYDAVLDQEPWNDVMLSVARHVGSDRAYYSSMAIPSGRYLFWNSSGFSREAADVWFTKFATPETNPWVAAAMAYRPGVIITTPMLPGEDELSHTDFWRQVVIASETQQFLGQLVLFDDAQVSHVSIYRGKRERPFDDDDEWRLRDLAPHLRRAAQLRLRLEALAGQRGAAMEVLDRLPFGVVLVGAGGRAVHVNRSAREILGKGDGLALSRGRLEASTSSEQRTLHRLVGQAVETGAGRGVSSGGALSVSRPSGLRPYGVLVSPLHGSALGSGVGTARAIVMVSDPDQAERDRSIVLRELYGLTAMESVIALSVVQGDNLKEVAESLGVSHNTARTHLAHVLLKTGARRQSELVRLLLCGPLAIELK